MKTTTHKLRRFASSVEIPKTYRELCQLYLPRPIRDDQENREATEMMNGLAVFEKLNAEQNDYLDVLIEFVDAYDKAKMKDAPWPKVSGLDLLKHLMSENGMSPADLSRVLGASRNLGAMILRGDRNLTLAHVRKLAEHFHVSPELFIS
ncbi:MAG: transcriptional regulator [Verrucomicrobia bacterium]|nr:transcriptional regulator [Verrucomicrobiota bacterium]